MNNKERLFELVRREEVVIWVGAGLSLYAGYPSSNNLKDILYNGLSKPEKRNIRRSLILPDFAEEFIKLKNNNRNELLRILESIFIGYSPKSMEYHAKLVSIPHIHTIITTNYDRLFEYAYKEKGHVIISPKKIPFIDTKKTQIFKVHGDFVDPESIIITKSDYLNFFSKNSEYNDLWTTVKTHILTKNILFIGYNIDDPNIEVIFNRITDSLGTFRRESFLVAPSLKPLKRNDLTQKGITYINVKGEKFIDELIENIKGNIISDQTKGFVSSDTCSKFLIDHKLYFELFPQNNKLNIGSIRASDNTVKSHLHFTVKGSTGFYNKFNEFILGKSVGQLELDVNHIGNAEFNIGGIRIPYIENAEKLIMNSIPQKKINVDIIFDDGFEFENIPTEIYGNHPFFHIHCKLNTAQIKIKLEVANDKGILVNLEYTPNKICSKISEEVSELTFFKNIFSGNKFKIYWNESKNFITESVPYQKPFNDYTDFFLTYFRNLKTIESHFKIRFSQFMRAEINNESQKIVEEIITLINRGTIKYKWNGVCDATLFDTSEETINALKKMTEKEDALVVANEQIKTEVSLHGQTLNLGYKQIRIENPYIINLQELLNKNADEMKLGSKSERIIISYTSTQNPQDNYILPQD